MRFESVKSSAIFDLMWKFTVFLCLPLFFLPQPAIAQESTYSIKYLTTNEGLLDNRVTSIFSDNNGFMWFGTQSGLIRYDGYSFAKHAPNSNDFSSVNSPTVEELYFDSRNNIWIGTQSGGLQKFNLTSESFTIYPCILDDSTEVSDPRIISFCEDDNKLWIGTWYNGINRYDYKTETFKHYLPGNNVSEIIKSRDNTIWAVGYFGFWKYDRVSDSFNLINMDGFYQDEIYLGITSVVEDTARNILWLGGWGQGVIAYDMETQVSARILGHLIDNSFLSGEKANVFSLHLDMEGVLWIGTWGQGLWKYQPDTNILNSVSLNSRYQKNIFNRDVIQDIFEDDDENFWIATYNGGIIRLTKRQEFQLIRIDNDDLNNIILSVIEDSNENLFIGTQEQGVFWRNKEGVVAPVFADDQLSIYETNLVFKRQSGQIWAGGDEDIYEIIWFGNTPGLVKWSDKNSIEHLEDIDQMRIPKARCIIEAGNKIYIGTKESSLFLLESNDDGSLTFLKQFLARAGEEGFLQNHNVACLLQDSKNRIWVGSHGGLQMLVNDSVFINSDSFIKDEQRLTCDIIYSILEDSKGQILVGTPCGINVLREVDDNQFELSTLDSGNGLSEDNVHGILEDGNTNIWISSLKSISRISLEDTTIKSFFESDGLEKINFHSARFQTSNGQLLFGGPGGIVKFDPDAIFENMNIPKIAISSFSILNTPVEIGKKFDNRVILANSINETAEIFLTHRENEFSFEISALDYNAPEKNQYAYKLEGYNEHWVYIGHRRRISFSNLRHGDYELRIKGSNNNGNWNEEGKSLKIIILPPWWKTWWAYSLFSLLFSSIVLLIIWTSVNQINLKRNVEMLQMKNQQEKSMNDMKFRFFTNISHEFKTPLTLIIGPISEMLTLSKVQKLPADFIKKTQRVYRNAQRLLNLVNQLLDFRKAEMGRLKLRSEYLNIGEFVEEIHLSFEELASHNEVIFQLENNLNDIHVWFDRDKLEIILNNLISNSFKYAGEKGIIQIVLDKDDQSVIIKVVDNGKGIPQEYIKNIFERFYQIESQNNYGSSGIGLALTKHYVEMHKGKLEVKSEPDVRTEFVVTLLMGNRHLSPEEMLGENDFIVSNKPVHETSHDSFPELSGAKKISKSDNSILIVEDNEEVRNYLRDLLSPLYNIEVANDGEQGFEKAITVSPELIISDIMMPKVDGFELCNKLRSHTKLSHIPIILLTAKPSQEYEVLGVRLGADEYISKPFDPDLLKEKINGLLRSRQRLQEHYSKKVIIEGSSIEIEPYEQKLIEKAIKVVELNLCNPEFNAEFLAHELNLSRSSCYRKLKSITGYSINAFIRKIKLDKAKQLLSDPEKTVTEIVYEVGFNDIKYFRECFEKQFGAPPMKLRKKL